MQYTEYELGELLPFEQPTAYIVKSTDYSDAYATPVLTAGKSFILGKTNETDGIFDQLPVIIFDDFTTATQFVNFRFKVKSSAMKILHINTNLVIPKYIFYRLQIIQFDHSTHKRYWIQSYSKIKVLIPPLDEQSRIVARIEELFSELDKTVDTLKTTKEQLEVYRQAVMKDAFQEKESIIRLGDAIEKPRYGTSKKCDYLCTANSTAVLRIPNIDTKNGRVDSSDLKYAEFNEKELEQLSLKNGDILIIRSNGSISLVGSSAIIRKCDTDKTYAGYLMRLRILNKEKLLPKYLLYYLSSPDARRYIESVAKSTSGVNNINSQEISKLCVPLSSIEKQEKTVAEIEMKLSVYHEIEKSVDTVLVQADAMRQSILKQAFEGAM
mgnify:CR=1 FL=1